MKAGMREFFSSPDPLVRNLLLSLPIWAIILMTYQIDSEYNNFYPGDSYDNLIFNTIFEFVGYVIADQLFERVGKRAAAKMYCLGFSILLICSIGIIFNDLSNHPYLDLYLTYVAKLGIAIAFGSAFWATTVLFPIVFASTTFGLCNAIGTTSCFFSVEVYNLPDTKT